MWYDMIYHEYSVIWSNPFDSSAQSFTHPILIPYHTSHDMIWCIMNIISHITWYDMIYHEHHITCHTIWYDISWISCDMIYHIYISHLDIFLISYHIPFPFHLFSFMIPTSIKTWDVSCIVLFVLFLPNDIHHAQGPHRCFSLDRHDFLPSPQPIYTSIEHTSRRTSRSYSINMQQSWGSPYAQLHPLPPLRCDSR